MGGGVDGGQGVEVKQQTQSTWFADLFLEPEAAGSIHPCSYLPSAYTHISSDIALHRQVFKRKLLRPNTDPLIQISNPCCTISISDPRLQPVAAASCPLENTHFLIYCLGLCSLSIPPTLSISWCWLDTLPPPTRWLTAQIQLNDPYKLDLMQCSCHSCFLPVGWTQIP